LELYEIIIKPCSGFGTSLKGDTIFGHFCWQAAHEPALLKGGLEKQIAEYPRTPFAIFSSAYPRLTHEETPYFFKRPDIPITLFMGDEPMTKKQKIQGAKQLKKKKWLHAGTDLSLNLNRNCLFSDEELGLKTATRKVTKSHNSIHRLTGTTGTGMFAPFETDIFYYHPHALLSVFVLVNPDATGIDQIIKGLTSIGKWGFGRDAATGMGRFDVQETRPLPLPDFSKEDALYTLAPCVPEKGIFRQKYFTPFVRFGKHGDMLAGSKNPFKNPVIMADEGAVLIPESKAPDKPYVGRAVTHLSKAMPETVVQGYSPVLPVNMGGKK